MPPTKPSRRRLGREALRAWYAPRRGAYPWRQTRDPYAIWVSEVMLQQTQAARVVPAYRSFLRRFPTVRALAAAPRRDVVAEWGGLGYNRRAVRLSEAARAIDRDHDGRIPRAKDELLELPGVGPYTAAAVASMGFGEPVAVVDTNVRRVVSRVHLGDRGSRSAGEGGVGARRRVAGSGRSRDVEPSRDGSRPGGVQAQTPLRRLPARPRLPVPPLGGGRATWAEASGTVRGLDQAGSGCGRERLALTPFADACAPRLGDRVPARSCRRGGRNPRGRWARRGRGRACAAVVMISFFLS